MNEISKNIILTALQFLVLFRKQNIFCQLYSESFFSDNGPTMPNSTTYFYLNRHYDAKSSNDVFKDTNLLKVNCLKLRSWLNLNRKKSERSKHLADFDLILAKKST